MLLAPWHICFPEPSVPGVCTTSTPLLHPSSEGASGFPFWMSAVFALASKLYELIIYFLNDPVELS